MVTDHETAVWGIDFSTRLVLTICLVLRIYMAMPITKMFNHDQRGQHLGFKTDAGRRKDQADYGNIHLQFLGMFKVDQDDQAAAFNASTSDFTFADGRKFSKARINELLRAQAEEPTRLWQVKKKQTELLELLNGRRQNGRTTRNDGSRVPKISPEEYQKRLADLRLLSQVLHTEKLLSDFAMECDKAGVLLEILTDEYTLGKWIRSTIAGLRVVPEAQRSTGWYGPGTREGDSMPFPLLFMVPKMEHNEWVSNTHKGPFPQEASLHPDAWRNMVHQRQANCHYVEYTRWQPMDLVRPIWSVATKAVGDALLWSHIASLSARTYNPLGPDCNPRTKRLDRYHFADTNPWTDVHDRWMESCEPFQHRIVNPAHLRGRMVKHLFERERSGGHRVVIPDQYNTCMAPDVPPNLPPGQKPPAHDRFRKGFFKILTTAVDWSYASEVMYGFMVTCLDVKTELKISS